MTNTTPHQVPRVVSEHPMWLTIPVGAPIPVRMRDDLDPHAPPAEYADGRVSWSGHPSREARDAARATAAEQQAQHQVAVARGAAAAQQRAMRLRHAEIRASLHTCRHASAHTDSRVYPYFGSVAADADSENRAAHGAVMEIDRCSCGAMRSRNVNQHHEEVGPWVIDEDRVSADGIKARDQYLRDQEI